MRQGGVKARVYDRARPPVAGTTEPQEWWGDAEKRDRSR